MSLISRITKNTETPESLGLGVFSLSIAEIELLLTLVKESTFKGEHVEVLYTLVYKLQQKHLNQQ
jgi:hypothetical protein